MKAIPLVLVFAAAGLALAGCATVEETVVEKTSKTFNVMLTGAQVPGGGDPDGSARAEVSISDGLDQLCYDVNDIRGIGPVTMAHIHRGAPGVNGPPIITLKQANEGGWKGCTSKSEWREDAIEQNPSGYYVNLHTAEFPNGAIRGQLRD